MHRLVAHVVVLGGDVMVVVSDVMGSDRNGW
jgi:hypothetical protein